MDTGKIEFGHDDSSGLAGAIAELRRTAAELMAAIDALRPGAPKSDRFEFSREETSPNFPPPECFRPTAAATEVLPELYRAAKCVIKEFDSGVSRSWLERQIDALRTAVAKMEGRP